MLILEISFINLAFPFARSFYVNLLTFMLFSVMTREIEAKTGIYMLQFSLWRYFDGKQ